MANYINSHIFYLQHIWSFLDYLSLLFLLRIWKVKWMISVIKMIKTFLARGWQENLSFWCLAITGAWPQMGLPNTIVFLQPIANLHERNFLLVPDSTCLDESQTAHTDTSSIWAAHQTPFVFNNSMVAVRSCNPQRQEQVLPHLVAIRKGAVKQERQNVASYDKNNHYRFHHREEECRLAEVEFRVTKTMTGMYVRDKNLKNKIKKEKRNLWWYLLLKKNSSSETK